MTKNEATTVVIDVAKKRKPHDRRTLDEAVAVLEPSFKPAKKTTAKKGPANVDGI